MVQRVATVAFARIQTLKCAGGNLLSMRRLLISTLIIVGAFAVFPTLLHRQFLIRSPFLQFVIDNPPRQLTHFIFTDGAGHSLTLSSFRGALILVNVWPTWCPPRNQEMTSPNHLASLY